MGMSAHHRCLPALTAESVLVEVLAVHDCRIAGRSMLGTRVLTVLNGSQEAPQDGRTTTTTTRQVAKNIAALLSSIQTQSIHDTLAKADFSFIAKDTLELYSNACRDTAEREPNETRKRVLL